MTSLKPVRWSYRYAGPGRDKTCCPLLKHSGISWFRKSKPLKNILYMKYFLNTSRPPFMDHISPKASLFHHIGDLDSTSQLHQTNNHHVYPFPYKEEESMKNDAEEEEHDINSQKLDQWVRDSAVEIVNNLDEAPFIVQIYYNNDGTNRDGSTPNTRIKTVKEKAIADNWPMIEGRWKGGNGTPNGVMLVEELKTPVVGAKTSDEMVNILGLNNQSCSSTKLWGILIQGKGKSCTACYLLKTSQVRCVAGLCTHFCLLRVECFVEHADIQLKKLWLQTS